MSRSAKKTLHVSRLVVENWRNFVHVDVPLQGRVFLVGPNASGKSNFLDVFRFLHDIASVGGGFQAAVTTHRGGVSKLRSLAARRYSDIQIEVQIGSGEEPRIWEYAIRFNQDQQKRPVIKSERVLRDGCELLSRPDPQDETDPARLTQTYLEQVHANRDFREIATFFQSIRYLHIVPQLIREPDRSVGRRDDPYGGDFLEQLASTRAQTLKARLRRVTEALKVALPQLRELELWRDPTRGTPHLRGKYEHWRPQGAWQTEEVFSDGTLRLLGLLWSVLDGAGPLLLEEPELSLHPDVVRFIPQMFARIRRRIGRQVLLSTHSPDLLRDEGIGVNEVLLLLPEAEGTAVRQAADILQIKALLEGGHSLAEVALPLTRPQSVEQLSLFGDR